MAGLAFGVTFGLMAVLAGTETYRVSLASAQLSIEWRTPVRLMRFLNDAHRRQILRSVGPSYQFRYALLQDRLAAEGEGQPQVDAARRYAGPALGHAAAAGRDMNITASDGGIAAGVIHGNVAPPGSTRPGLVIGGVGPGSGSGARQPRF